MMSHHEPFDLLEGMSLFVIFSPNEWSRSYPDALRSGRDPDARDERDIAKELACDPTEQDEEATDEDGRPQGTDEDVEPADWQMKLLDARPGKPFVYDEEVKRAEKCRQLEKIVFEAIGYEFGASPSSGLNVLAQEIRESGFFEIQKAINFLRRFQNRPDAVALKQFRDMQNNEFDRLRWALAEFSQKRIRGTDTGQPLRMALECRNAPAAKPCDRSSLSFEEMMDQPEHPTSEDRLRELIRLVSDLYQRTLSRAAGYFSALRAWEEIKNL